MYQFRLNLVVVLFTLNTLVLNAISESEDLAWDTVYVGFAKCSLVPVISSSTPFRRDLEAVCAVIRDGHTRIALVALDLIEITPQTNVSLQSEISKITGFPEHCILLHTTHTHTSPWDSREHNSMDNLGIALAEMILKADESAVPSTLRIANADVGKSLSFQRIGYAGEELGYQTFWYGFQIRANDSRPDANALVNEMKSRWFGNASDYTPGKNPVWFDREVDPLVQTLVFEDLRGNTIGTIVRFSAHIGPADSCNPRKYDPDFAAVVRDHIEKELGGTGMYLSGPLGNLAPNVKIDYVIDKEIQLPDHYLGPTWALVAQKEKQALAERDRIGEAIATAALQSLKEQNCEMITHLDFRSEKSKIPLDPVLPQTLEDIELIRKTLMPESLAFKRRGGNVSELHLLANRLNWLEWTQQFLHLISPEERHAGFTKLPLSVLRINDTFLAFMHSEPMAETSLELRKAFPSLNLIPVCLTGGTVQYIPTAEIMDMGGYEGRATIIRRDGEAIMRSDLSSMVNELLEAE